MNYRYQSLSVPGGGFVTGFLFHPREKNILYCRTDIGGVYRYDFGQEQWIALVDQVTGEEKWKTYPLSIALDAKFPNRLYMSVGEGHQSAIGYSQDYGHTFTYMDTPKNSEENPVEIHGNASGRSTGERLLVDPLDSDILYLGTMYDGLFRTSDHGKTWHKLQVGEADEHNITFIAIDERGGEENGRGKRVLVGTSGEKGSPDGIVRGPSVYISNNGGKSFTIMAGQPEPVLEGPLDHPGYVAQRIAFDKNYMYITYSSYNVGWSNWNMYGCDTGACSDGALYRYQLDHEGRVHEVLDITPGHPFIQDYRKDSSTNKRLGYGLSGIATDPTHPGLVVLTTITASPDVFYRSWDYGITFEPIMSGLEIGHIEFNISYQHPDYNGKHSLIHWMSDIKINPFNPNMALFNTGAGVFATFNLLEDAVIFKTFSEGMEETVHLNVYAPVREKPAVIDVIGDYGLFVFEDVNHKPETSASDVDGNRWITAMNADFTDGEDSVIIATLRGNWTGKTKGGLVISRDNGKSYHKLPDPQPITPAIDEAIKHLSQPNVTSGWIAMSSNTKHLVWAIGQPLDGDLVIFTHDQITYGKSTFLNSLGHEIDVTGKPIKIFADRVLPHIFYGFGDVTSEGPSGFISNDYGETFHEVPMPQNYPKVLLAGIDSEQHIEIRPVPNTSGLFYMALNDKGLWLLSYEKDRFVGRKVSREGDTITRIGIGIGDDTRGHDESSKEKSPHIPGKFSRLYTSGRIQGIYGFYSSDNGGADWVRINDDAHQFGDIRSIDGDKQVPGRFYIATGTRGLLYGEPSIDV